MATFMQNINKIRGEAVYGREIRTAIADAILQSMNLDIDTHTVPYPDTQQVYVSVSPVVVGSDDYILGISKTNPE